MDKNKISKYDEYQIRTDRYHKYFHIVMEKLMERYRQEVFSSGKSKEDKDFAMWQIIKEAYDSGYTYFRDEIFDLTDAEDHYLQKAEVTFRD